MPRRAAAKSSRPAFCARDGGAGTSCLHVFNSQGFQHQRKKLRYRNECSPTFPQLPYSCGCSHPRFFIGFIFGVFSARTARRCFQTGIAHPPQYPSASINRRFLASEVTSLHHHAGTQVAGSGASANRSSIFFNVLDLSDRSTSIGSSDSWGSTKRRQQARLLLLTPLFSQFLSRGTSSTCSSSCRRARLRSSTARVLFTLLIVLSLVVCAQTSRSGARKRRETR